MHKINNTYKRIVASVPVRICNYTERGILPQKHYPTFTIYKAPIITPYESKSGLRLGARMFFNMSCCGYI